MSMMLSKSKVNTFSNCPLRFKYTYIDQYKTESNEFAQLGIDVHDIAEKFIKSWPIPKKSILSTLMDLEKNYDNDYLDHVKNLASFFNHFLIDAGFKVFMAEEKIFSEKYNFNGLCDLVLENENGKLIVIDYKTGKTNSVNKYKLELCYYKLLLEDKFPDKEVEYAGIFYTKNGDFKSMKFYDDKDSEFDDSQISNDDCSLSEYNLAINYIETVRIEIESNHFPPKKQHLCKYCDFLDKCNDEL